MKIISLANCVAIWIRESVLNSAGSYIHLRFKDRSAAGKLLAAILSRSFNQSQLINYPEKVNPHNVLVLGIPRGGVIVAREVAKKLCADFDIVMPRRLLAPGNRELTLGAIMEDKTCYLNEDIIKNSAVTPPFLEEEMSIRINEIQRRISIYSNSRTMSVREIRDKKVIIVDDGACSGATIMAAVRWVRKRGASEIVAAIPVAPKQTINIINREADSVECITMPDISKFSTVDQFYANYDQITDTQVQKVIGNSF
jgi:putative phosphoribosyl transferase